MSEWLHSETEITDALKQIYKDAAARRKERGITQKRWSVLIETNLHSSIEEMWEEWVALLGSSDRAAILLQHLMIQYSEALRHAKMLQDRKKK